MKKLGKIGEIYYSLQSPTDGGAVWTEKTWSDYHTASIFKLLKVYGGILKEESRDLFQRFLEINPLGGASDLERMCKSFKKEWCFNCWFW